jgi:hypothetical protein
MEQEGNPDNNLSVLYKSAIKSVLNIESHKKDLAEKLLMLQGDKRWVVIRRFLEYDLKKHLILEQAAIIVMSNKANSMVNELEKLYKYTNEKDLISKIRKEINIVEDFIKIIDKGIKHKSWLSFSERRAIQEINKYVIEQARVYKKL